MVHVFQNIGESSTARNYLIVSLLSVVNRVYEKLLNNRVVDHVEKCGLFSDFQYRFRSSHSTADPLVVACDRITRAFISSGLIYPMLSTGFGMLVFFRKFQVRCLVLFLLFLVMDGFGWFWMGSYHKNVQLMLKFLKGPLWVLHFSYYT